MKDLNTVAIDTVPLPESPPRFEHFFLDHLVEAGAITEITELALLSKLSLVAIGTWPTPESPYFLDIDSVAGVVVTDGKQLIVDCLEANGHLGAGSRMLWARALKTASLAECLPGILRSVDPETWTSEATVEVLDSTFAAAFGVGKIIEGSDLDEHCRKHPMDPICLVSAAPRVTLEARRLGQEVLIVTELHRRGLLTTDQTRAVLETYFTALTPTEEWTDISTEASATILEALDLEPLQRNTVRRGLARRGVGLVDPDSPWADICSGANPPPACKFMRAFPRAAALTLGLVRSKVWEFDEAIEAWNSLGDS